MAAISIGAAPTEQAALPVQRRFAEALAWSAVLAFAAVALVFTHLISQDPDPRLYAGIGARLAGLPMHDWIAPEWWNLWSGFEGPYREHPAGVFLLPAVLGNLGFPAAQGAFLAGVAFS